MRHLKSSNTSLRLITLEITSLSIVISSIHLANNLISSISIHINPLVFISAVRLVVLSKGVLRGRRWRWCNSQLILLSQLSCQLKKILLFIITRKFHRILLCKKEELKEENIENICRKLSVLILNNMVYFPVCC